MTIYKNAIGGDHQEATFIIAASDSQHPERADYVCDGTADQVQIQAAIDAVELGGGASPQHHGKSGAIIALLPGRYIIDDVITIESNIFLTGSGFTATEITLADNSDCGMIYFTNYQGVSDTTYGSGMSNMTLNGNKANQTGDWWNLYGLLASVSDAYFDHMWIEDCGTGIRSAAMWSTYFNQISIESCTQAIYLNAQADNCIKYVLFNGMNIYNKTELRAVSTNSYADRVTFRDCNFGAQSADALELEGNVFNCLIENSVWVGTLEATYYNIKLVDSAIGNPENIKIVGNTFPHTTGAGNIDLPVGCDYNMITRNRFSHATPFTIALGGNANGMIYRNRGYVTENAGTATLVSGTTLWTMIEE